MTTTNQITDINFTIDEFCKSEIATRHGIKLIPDARQATNLMWLIIKVLQPARNEAVKRGFSTRIDIISGIRNAALIAAAAKEGITMSTTGHPDGECADPVFPGKTTEQSFNFMRQLIKEGIIEVDQLIWEKDSNCLHVGYKKPINGKSQNRKQIMIRTVVGGKFNYQTLAA